MRRECGEGGGENASPRPVYLPSSSGRPFHRGRERRGEHTLSSRCASNVLASPQQAHRQGTAGWEGSSRGRGAPADRPGAGHAGEYEQAWGGLEQAWGKHAQPRRRALGGRGGGVPTQGRRAGVCVLLRCVWPAALTSHGDNPSRPVAGMAPIGRVDDARPPPSAPHGVRRLSAVGVRQIGRREPNGETQRGPRSSSRRAFGSCSARLRRTHAPRGNVTSAAVRRRQHVIVAKSRH